MATESKPLAVLDNNSKSRSVSITNRKLRSANKSLRKNSLKGSKKLPKKKNAASTTTSITTATDASVNSSKKRPNPTPSESSPKKQMCYKLPAKMYYGELQRALDRESRRQGSVINCKAEHSLYDMHEEQNPRPSRVCHLMNLIKRELRVASGFDLIPVDNIKDDNPLEMRREYICRHDISRKTFFPGEE